MLVAKSFPTRYTFQNSSITYCKTHLWQKSLPTLCNNHSFLVSKFTQYKNHLLLVTLATHYIRYFRPYKMKGGLNWSFFIEKSIKLIWASTPIFNTFRINQHKPIVLPLKVSQIFTDSKALISPKTLIVKFRTYETAKEQKNLPYWNTCNFN